MCLAVNLVHMVPEVLRGEPGRVGGEQAGERRLAIPVGEVQLAGGGDDAVDGRQEHVLAAREALMALGGERGIEQGEHLQAPGDMPEGSHIAEGGHHGLLGLWGLVAGLGGGDQVLDTAEIDGTDDFGFAVDALTVAGVVIGVAVDFLGGEAWHVSRSYNKAMPTSSPKSKRSTKCCSGEIELHYGAIQQEPGAGPGTCAERSRSPISRSYKSPRNLKKTGKRPTS